jgi:hypothetical protein
MVITNSQQGQASRQDGAPEFPPTATSTTGGYMPDPYKEAAKVKEERSATAK